MRVVMLTDDVQIDRRILLEAETLHRLGHELILLAENGGASQPFEQIGNVKIERVRYPDVPPGGVYLLRASTLFSAAMSRTSGCIVHLCGLLTRGSAYAFSLLSRFCIGFFGAFARLSVVFFSAVIRLNQATTAFVLRGIQHWARLSLLEETIVKRVLFYNPDVIHVHDLPRLRAGAKAKRRLKVPLVYDAHELYPEIATLTPADQKKLAARERRFIRDADVVITVNKYIAAEMAKRYRVATPDVIRNATDWPHGLLWNRPWNLFRERFEIPQEHQIILFQGWMSAQRGLQPLVRAMTALPEHLHLVFMGYGEGRIELEAIVAEHSLDGRVHFMDAVPQEELLGWTRSADAGIIPYQPIDLNNYYCSPNKLFEFIQAELPIVANDLPFLRDVVAQEGFGIVHRLETVEDYATAIGLMFDGNRRQTFRDNLRLKKLEYSWSIEERKLVALYQALGSRQSCI